MPKKTGEIPTDKYTARVAEIRQLPRHTPEQRQAVKKQIVEVRRGVKKDRFAVAFAAAFLEPLLVANPYLTADEANALAKAHFSSEARFTALRTIDVLRSQADDARRVLSYFVQRLSPWATDIRSVNAGDLGKAFFRVYAGREPVGNCALYYEPFGVYLALGEKHWGGSLPDSEAMAKKLDGVIDLAKTAERLNRYPVIRLWGRIVEGWARKNFQIWANQLRHQALGEAKDEIVSELYAPGGDLDQKAASLKEKDFIYDYLAEAGLKKTNGTLLAGEAGDLRKSYNTEINRATAVAKGINTFLADLGFESSRKVAWGLLAPEPIERWPIFYHKNFTPERMAVYQPFIGLRREAQTHLSRLNYIFRGLMDFDEHNAARPYNRAASNLKVEIAAISDRLQKSFEAHAGEISAIRLMAEEERLRRVIKETQPLIDMIPGEEIRLQGKLGAKLEETLAFCWRARTEGISRWLSAQRQKVLDARNGIIVGLVNQNQPQVDSIVDIDTYDFMGHPLVALDVGFYVVGNDGLKSATIKLNTPGQKTMASDASTLGRTDQRISGLMKTDPGKQLASWEKRFSKLGKLMEANRDSIFRTLRAARNFLEPVEIGQLEQLVINLEPLERQISAEVALVQRILAKYRQ